MRRLTLSILLIFASFTFAGEHVLTWRVSGHKVKTSFETKISTSSNQQTITHSFPQGFSFSQIMTGTQQAFLDNGFITAATPSTTITVISENTVQIENDGISVQTQSLLNLMYAAFQSSSNTAIPDLGMVSLGLGPIPLLPGSNSYLDQVSSDNITVNGHVVHTNLHVNYGHATADYGLILEQADEGFHLILTHSAIEVQNIQEILTNVHDEGIEGDGLHEEVNFSVFIPTQIMLDLTGSQSTADSQPNLAALTGAALLVTTAAKSQQ